MTPTDIAMEICAPSLDDAIAHTRYALAKQVPSAYQVASHYGLIVLAAGEEDELRAFLAQLLERRLETLKGAS